MTNPSKIEWLYRPKETIIIIAKCRGGVEDTRLEAKAKA